MMALATLRKHFGLSQSQLARLLQVSDAYIKMAETGSRNLSPLVLEKYLDLVKLVETTTVVNKSSVVKVHSKSYALAHTELKKYIITTRAQLILQQKSLTKMETNCLQAYNRLFLLLKEQKKHGHTEATKHWIELLVAKTKNQLQKNSPHARALVQLKMDIHTYGLQQALQLERQLNEL